jgi:hypothetical protein
MRPSMKNILLSAMAVIVLLSACQPALPQPTQNAVDVESEVATIVALTVAAQNAQTQAAVSPTPEATNTTLPTQTEEGVPSPTALATLTALPTATVVVLPTSSSGGGGGGTTQREYACDTIRRRPFDNTSYRPGDTFDIKWTIVNTGTKTMVAGLDLKYNSGTQMTNRTRVELPELKPGAQFAVDFDAVAPNKEGTYIMTFLVEGGLCYPYVAIIVEK